MEAFLGDRALTTTELRSKLPDVPVASLYRHVALLVDAGRLAVVAEHRVRVALERTYVLRVAAANIGLNELAEMTPDDHRHAFMAFVAGLLRDFDRYLARGEIDLLRDGVSYRIAGMWLDDAELAELLRGYLRCSDRTWQRGEAFSQATDPRKASSSLEVMRRPVMLAV